MAGRGDASRGPMDWAEIRSRMEAVGRELFGAPDAAPERARAVLEERARALARPVASRLPVDMLKVITFALANEVYAIESRCVVAVGRLANLSPLPGAEPPVFGVTAWRGELLTILDLRQVLGISASALDDLSYVIVLGEERAAFGILADAMREVTTLPASAIRTPSEGVASRREYLRGITGEAVLVLDAGQLLRLHRG